MNDKTRESPRIVSGTVERQMRTWELARQADEAQQHAGAVPHAHRLGPYVALSRETGAGGSDVAQALGARLGWEVLDKDLLDRVAAVCQSRPDILALVDETANSWIHDVLGTWLDSALVPHDKYVAKLERVVLAAARHGNVIFVGRGAGLLLPRAAGVSVRIVAPRDARVRYIMEHDHLDAVKAREHVRRVDEGRHQFVRQHFHRDLNDAHLYDLVINLEHLDVSAAVEMIAAALTVKGLVRPALPLAQPAT